MLVTAIGGIPAAGKTTLMRRMIQRLEKRGMAFPFKSGLVVGTQFPNSKVEIIGDYNTPDLFAGTDKLSMAVQPKFINYLKIAKGLKQDFHIIFEGDRLFNPSLFEQLDLLGIDYEMIVLTVSKDLQRHRCFERGSNQPETMLKSKDTKISNILKKFPLKAQVRQNNDLSDMNATIGLILDRIEQPHVEKQIQAI